jgi:hypothetical protein
MKFENINEAQESGQRLGKIFGKGLGFIIGLVFVALILILPMSFWMSFQLLTIFGVQFPAVGSALFLLAYVLLAPKSINGLLSLVFIIGQLYIWFVL